MTDVVVKFVADTQGLLPAVQIMKTLGQLSEEQAAEIDRINTKQKENISILNQSATAAGKLDNEIKDLGKTIGDEVFKKPPELLDPKEGGPIPETIKKTKTLKQELKELKAQIASGQLEGAELEKAALRAGELSDAIEDASRQVKAFAGNRLENNLKAIGEGVQLATAGFAAYQSIVTLTGSKNEELQKTMVRVQAAATLLESATTITNLLQKESALIQGILTGRLYGLDKAQRLVAIGARVMGVETATATAIMSGGLTVILGLVAAAAMFAMGEEELTDSITKTSSAMDDQKRAAGDLADKLSEVDADLAVLSGSMTQREADILKSDIKNKKERISAEDDYQKLKEKAVMDGIKQVYKDETEAQEMLKKLEWDKGYVRLKVKADIDSEEYIAAISANKKLNKLAGEHIKYMADIETLGNKEKEIINKKHDEKEAQARKSSAEKARQAKAQADKQAMDDAKALAAWMAAESVARAKRELAIYTDEDLEPKLKAEEDYHKALMDQIDNNFKAQGKTNSEQHQTALAEETDRYNERVNNLRTNYWDKVMSETERKAEEQRKLEERLFKLNMDEQTENFASIQLAQLQLEKNNYDGRKELLMEWLRTKNKETYLQFENEGKLGSEAYKLALAQNKAEFESQMKALDDTMEARRKEYEDAAINSAMEIVNAVNTITANNRKAETDAQLEDLNTRREAALSNANLTESQKMAIEKRFRNEEKAIKRQAWEADKQAAIVMAVINTAVAVTKALPNVLQAVAAGVAGAAQVAVIASQKPPKFAKGTEFVDGPGTGTSDSIYAMLSRGERVVPAKINDEYFEALSAIQNRKVEPGLANNIMESLASGSYRLAAFKGSRGVGSANQMDYERLAQIVKQGRTNVEISMDEKGFKKYMINELSRTEYVNKKLRIKT